MIKHLQALVLETKIMINTYLIWIWLIDYDHDQDLRPRLTTTIKSTIMESKKELLSFSSNELRPISASFFHFSSFPVGLTNSFTICVIFSTISIIFSFVLTKIHRRTCITGFDSSTLSSEHSEMLLPVACKV